ncbi:unnamed protein product [Phytophthora fragariaefolia]|uniref:Unnamed protein product n=1 Tax=Phytophthora fragariaefolia TaxID=1490495 RepID=A0A9W7D5L8_9STRA|nr:unnamed protein product [Phytophthora fragariaefolia]
MGQNPGFDSSQFVELMHRPRKLNMPYVVYKHCLAAFNNNSSSVDPKVMISPIQTISSVASTLKWPISAVMLGPHNKVQEENQGEALRRKLDLSGGRVSFLSDVWQNIAKMHLLGCMLSLFGIIFTYGSFLTGARHDGIAIAEQMEKVMEKIEADGWVIGAIVTDDAGQCGRARRILALRHPVCKAVLHLSCVLKIRSSSLARYHSDREFPEELQVLGDPRFWRDLEIAEQVIRPLSNASYKLQRDENTLADVIISYRDIYRGFLADLEHLELVSLVEEGWMKCEQPLVLLALFLHPLHVHVAVAIPKASPELQFL